MPGVNLRSVGTIRDAQKWPKRDNRKDSRKLDPINFNLLSPYTIQKMIKGVEILRNIQQTSGETTGIYTYQNCNIKNSSLKKGIEFYNIAINKFLGNSLISRLKDNSYSNIEEVIAKLQPDTEKGSGEWIDLSGLIAPKNIIDTLLCEIEENKHNLDQIQQEFENTHKNYYKYEWTWALSKLLK